MGLVAIPSRRTLRLGSYAALLLSMLTMFFLGPHVGMASVGSRLLGETLILLVLVSTLASAVHRRRILLWLIALSLVGEVLVLAGLARGVPLWVPLVGGLLRVLFLLLAAGVVLLDVLRTDRVVTLDKILGATCAYLLIGFAFALVFAMLHHVDPGAFRVQTWLQGDGEWLTNSSSVFVYFSFVTLSTLGYGDVTPVAPLARSLVMVETILGQFYIAVVVARLVALHVLAHPTRDP